MVHDKCSETVRSYYYLTVVVIVHAPESKAVKTQLKLVYRRYAIPLKQRPWVITEVNIRIVMLVMGVIIKFYTFKYWFTQTMIKS